MPRLSPDILVVDSLNMVATEKRNEFFEKIVKRNYGSTKLIIVVLDSYKNIIYFSALKIIKETS